MKLNFTILLILIGFPTAVWAQSTDKTDVSGKIGLLYEHEWSLGGRLTTNGWGIVFNLGKALSYDKSRFYQIEFLEMKHPKETKQTNDYARHARYTPKPFVFGKQNNFYTLHLGYGQKLFLGDKAEKSGVEVNLTYSIGPSIGLLKPYYLDIGKEQNSPTGFPEFDQKKYDPENPAEFLSLELIRGSSGFAKGLAEMKFIPGVHGKAGINFDWANYNEIVKALEVGVGADVFPKRIPIMIEERNNPYFIYLYLGIQFGKKW